jgi:hypothetical protein
MLDLVKVMRELERVMPTLYTESSNERELARTLFYALLERPELLEQLKESQSPYPVPLWQGALDEHMPVEAHPHPYAVLAVDGSQIYPDKHQGMQCYLINSGIVHFTYGQQSAVTLSSVPALFTQIDDPILSEDIVNCRRAELEFEIALQEAIGACEQHPDLPFVSLCDGSLIFWHLESKSPALKERFLKRYLEQLDQFYQQQIPLVGYISLPKSKELIALLRNTHAQKLLPEAAEEFDTLVDTDLLSFFLPQGHRSTIFEHTSALAKQYPPHLKPYFTFLHVGSEIARVEFPAWIAQDEMLLSRSLRIIQDQCVKGHGYPIALSEAHEQAVVKSPDREQFFRLLGSMTVRHNYRQPHSLKSIKKRFVSV